MAPLIVSNAYLVSIRALSGGQDIVNVVGIKAGFSSASQVASAVLTAWKIAGGPLTQLPTQYVLQEVKAMELTTAEAQIATQPATGNGSIVGSVATNGACALVTYGAGTRSKSQRGRMYFGPLPESSINSDGRTISTATATANALNAFRNSIQTQGMEWGVISRKLATFTGISQVGCQTVLATQRRRIR